MYSTTKLLCASVVALCASGALSAADAAGPASWTGCYVGANGGYGSGSNHLRGDPTDPDGYLVTNVVPDGGLLGGQLGCDYQLGDWVIGLEGSYDAANLHGSAGDGYDAEAYYDTARVTDLGSVAARAGWSVTPQTLLYAKAGWAFAHDKYFNNYYPITAKQDRSGWTIGGGFEWAFAENFSTFVECDYYDLGTATANYVPVDYNVRIKQTLNSVIVGVNFRM